VNESRTRPWRSQPAAPRYAAIDIGSDTVHLLVADLSGTAVSGTLQPVHSESELVELGRVVGRRGRITETAEAEIGKALDRMVRRAGKSGASILIAATEATRRASNGQAVLTSLGARVKVPIRLLSPTREAELGFAGVRPELPPEGELVVIDSGGASTEATLTRGRLILAAASLPVGAALLATALSGDPPPPIDWALAAIRIGASLGSLPRGNPRHAFATGGTAHGLLAVGSIADRHEPASNVIVTLAELEQIAALLLARPSRRIGAEAGIDPRRVALLAPGVLILGAILRHYGLGDFHVVQAGVREGMIRAAAADPGGWWLDPPAPPA
jgi:exopolyphosphatase / guanosine-5'-triphosphate,3'-diphosphate pyrophosphatase